MVYGRNGNRSVFYYPRIRLVIRSLKPEPTPPTKRIFLTPKTALIGSRGPSPPSHATSWPNLNAPKS